MRAPLCVCSAFVVVIAVVCAACGEREEPPLPRGRILGRVCGGSGLRALAGARVVAREDDIDVSDAVSNDDGDFALDVGVGSYDVLSIEDAGDVVIAEDVVVDKDAAVTVIDVRCRN